MLKGKHWFAKSLDINEWLEGEKPQGIDKFGNLWKSLTWYYLTDTRRGHIDDIVGVNSDVVCCLGDCVDWFKHNVDIESDLSTLFEKVNQGAEGLGEENRL